MNHFIHQLADCLRFIGLRDRLRCPKCKAIGTYKPHGGWFDFSDVRKVRRWMCKWCGHYKGPELCNLVTPSPSRGCWVLLSEEPESITPEIAVKNNFWTRNTWPWRG